MLISMDEMHLLVRSEEARPSAWKTLPGLAQVFVSKTCTFCSALCTEFLCPSGIFAGVFAVSVRAEQRWLCCSPFLFLPWAVAALPGLMPALPCGTGELPVLRARSVRPQRIPVAERDNRGWGRRLPPPERHFWGHTVRCFQFWVLNALWCLQPEIQQRLVPRYGSGACDAQAYYKLRNFFCSSSSPFFLFSGFVFSNGISSLDCKLCQWELRMYFWWELSIHWWPSLPVQTDTR